MFVFVFLVTGLRTDKELYRAKVCVYFGAIRIDTEFQLSVSIPFLIFFKGHVGSLGCPGTPRSKVSPHLLARIAVCVGEAVPVASGLWHGLGWAKVLAR
jgi:hypothetical protein